MSADAEAHERHRFHALARGALAATLVLLALWTLQGFLPALVWAAIFAIALWPLYARAERRWKEMVAGGREVTLADIAADIRQRDERDSNRPDAPLRVAEGAFVIDTSALTREQAIAAAVEAVETARRG